MTLTTKLVYELSMPNEEDESVDIEINQDKISVWSENTTRIKLTHDEFDCLFSVVKQSREGIAAMGGLQ